MQSIGVVVSHDDHGIVEQVAEAVEAAPDLFVAATSITSATPAHVLVAGGESLVMLQAAPAPLVALADGDAVRAARAALAVGARDIVRWPEESARLPGAIRRAASPVVAADGSGRVMAVASARGGAGATTIAAAIAARAHDAVVIDLDHVSAGQRGFAADAPSDVGPPEDPSPDMLDAMLVAHAGGSRCLHIEPLSDAMTARHAHGLLRAARRLARLIVVDCGRVSGPAAKAAWTAADTRLLVVANDIASLRGARALQDRIGRPSSIVVRRARAAGVPLRDLTAALGVEPAAVVPFDRALARAADLGRLPSRRSRALRAIGGLVDRVVAEPSS